MGIIRKNYEAQVKKGKLKASYQIDPKDSRIIYAESQDGNISRKHCAVIRKNGGYFIKDLGSTNGIVILKPVA